MPNWKSVLDEVKKLNQEAAQTANTAIDIVRRNYLKKLYEKVGRNVIAYYSGFLEYPGNQSCFIAEEDKAGFMGAINKLDRKKGLDLLLHSPGGEVAAADSLIHYLHEMFGNNIRVFVPQIAMSAGTILACSAKEIYMGKHSSLGPTNPILNGFYAHEVIEEFEQAQNELIQEPKKIASWQFILNKYQPSFLLRCRRSIDFATECLRRELSNNMLQGKTDEEITNVVLALNDIESHKLHEHRIHYQQAIKIGLNIKMLEDDQELQDLVLTVHHCYMHTLTNFGVVKAIENHEGVAYIKRGELKPG